MVNGMIWYLNLIQNDNYSMWGLSDCHSFYTVLTLYQFSLRSMPCIILIKTFYNTLMFV